MKPRDIFKLAVRLLGLIFLYQGLQALAPAAVQLCRELPRINSDMIVMTLVSAGWPLLVAYWLLRGAPLVMGIAYPDATDSAKPETPIGGALEKSAKE